MICSTDSQGLTEVRAEVYGPCSEEGSVGEKNHMEKNENELETVFM